MKKLFYSVLFLVLAVSFQSCSSDDDGGGALSLDNTVTINGESFDLNDLGFIIGYGENEDGSFDWDVILSGPGGAEVYLDLNTNSEEGLVEGTYTYSDTRAPFRYVYAEARASNEESYYVWEQGAIEIDINGNNVSIVLNVTAEEDSVQVPIEVEWSGTLTIDNSDD